MAEQLEFPIKSWARVVQKTALGLDSAWVRPSLVTTVARIIFLASACGRICFGWQSKVNYRKIPKNSDTRKICCNYPKIWTTWLYSWEMCPKDVDGIANSVDPDQTAPLGAVWSGSTLFALTYLSENLGTIWYSTFSHHIRPQHQHLHL